MMKPTVFEPKPYKVVAVDFDGTITCDSEYTGKGMENYPEPNKPIVRLMNGLHAIGHKVVVWTCRTTDEYADIRFYCDFHGILIDGINTNKFSPVSWKANRKIYADIYLDDRAINVKDALELDAHGFLEAIKDRSKVNQ